VRIAGLGAAEGERMDETEDVHEVFLLRISLRGLGGGSGGGRSDSDEVGQIEGSYGVVVSGEGGKGGRGMVHIGRGVQDVVTINGVDLGNVIGRGWTDEWYGFMSHGWS
jgi:hypothetical protein